MPAGLFVCVSEINVPVLAYMWGNCYLLNAV